MISKTFEVRAVRQLGGGATVELTGTSFGRDEKHARAVFHRLFNRGTGEDTMGEKLIWHDHELILREVPAEGGAR